MNIKIENLTKPQELAIESMLAVWLECSGIGHSEYVAFFADGDGNFHPKITVDGKRPERYKFKDGKTTSGINKDGKTLIDYDPIAWDLRGTGTDTMTKTDEMRKK